MLEDKDVTNFQAYILYSKNISDILKRIVNYLGDCNKIIADIELGNLLKEICIESKPRLTEFRSYDVVRDLINNELVGKGIVFKITSPKDDIYAIAFIPINEFNKSIVSKR